MEGGKKEVGKRGEDAAARYIEKRGYKIVERNFTCPLGEMDIIALDRKTLCFIEVKTLSGKAYGPPEIAVNVHKQEDRADQGCLRIAVSKTVRLRISSSFRSSTHLEESEYT